MKPLPGHPKAPIRLAALKTQVCALSPSEPAADLILAPSFRSSTRSCGPLSGQWSKSADTRRTPSTSCCLRVIGGGNVALLVLIVASALVCQQTWIFSSPYLPWGPDTLRQEWDKVRGPGIIPGRHRGQLCARIPSDQCTSIHHCCTRAGQRTNTSGAVEGNNVLITAAKPSS